MKCENCHRRAATAFIKRKQVCQKCYLKLKVSKRIGGGTLSSWFDKYFK